MTVKNTYKIFFACLTIGLLTAIVPCKSSAQATITDSLLHKISSRFEKANGYMLDVVIESVNHHTNGLPPDLDAACLTGKEMLVVAVFGAKPTDVFARMLVTKRYNKKTAHDEHQFQAVEFEKSFGIYYALLRVAFPAEANNLNCGVNLQVFDKSNPSAKVWLLVFSK